MNPADNSEVNPADNSGNESEVNPADNSEDESGVNPADNPGIIYEMDPLDAPPIQWITKKNEESDDTPVGKPKHLRTESYEDNKSGLAAIFENVKTKVD